MRVDDGGEDSFEDFVRARGDALWRRAWWLTTDAHTAEDLVQTALVKSHGAWSRVGSAGFEAYVRRVMFTTFLGWRRRRWHGEGPRAELPETAQLPQDHDQRHDLHDAVRRLPRGQRAVIVLRYLDDLTERQTAELLGCSVGTVKSQTARALAALRADHALGRVGEDR